MSLLIVDGPDADDNSDDGDADDGGGCVVEEIS